MRLLSILIVLFCGIMTTLLVRSVYWPEESRLSAVAPQVPMELFLKRTEGTSLDIWDANRITGVLHLTPSGILLRSEQRSGGRLGIQATLRLAQPIMGAELLALEGSCFMSLDGSTDDLDIMFKLPSPTADMLLKVRQPRGDRWPSITLSRGDTVLFSSTGGAEPDAANSSLVSMITTAAGWQPEALFARREAAPPPIVRAGRISAGGEEFDGYYFAPGGEDGGSFQMYMANTGEILRIETSFSHTSGLGLRFLSQALRPAGTSVPDLNLYPLPPAPAP